MTDPTADAAKLLPCRECEGAGTLEHVAMPDGEAWIKMARIKCLNCVHTVYASSDGDAIYLWNTRPQPAPPAGGPDFQEIAREIAGLCGKHYAPYPGFTPHPGYVADTVMQPLMVLLRDRLGLAARPKVEDDEWLKTTTLYAQWKAAEAKLAEREAELAKADAVIVERVAAPQSWQSKALHNTYRAAQERHGARQRQKD